MGLPDVFQGLDRYTDLSAKFWKAFIGKYYGSILEEALFCLMEDSNMNGKNLYERCARELTKEDFAKEETRILEKNKDE